MKHAGWIVALLLLAVLVMAPTQAPSGPVNRVEFPRVSWATGAGHAAQTTTATVNGCIQRIDIIVSSVTANPTVNATFADQNGTVCVTAQSNLADGTNHFLNALVNSITTSADFNPVAVCGDLTVTLDPSADPGGAGQVLSIDVIAYVR